MRDALCIRGTAIHINKGGPPTTQKQPVATLVKHSPLPCPSSVRRTDNTVFKGKCNAGLPDGNKCHLHPVFKYIDNFFSNSTHAGLSRIGCPTTKRKIPGRGGHNCCLRPKSARQVIMNSNRPLVQLESNMSCGVNPVCQSVSNEQQDRVNTNLNNINTNCGFRVSVNKICPNCQHENEVPKVVLTNTPNSYQKAPMNPDFYVEQLRNEIKQANSRTCYEPPKTIEEYIKALRAQYCYPNSTEQYVKKLKQEIACNKSKFIEETRNVINELQDEILNYRLQTKAKYSSSCSNVGFTDKSPTPSPLTAQQPSRECTPLELRQIGESPRGVRAGCLDALQNDSSRNCCETIWRSKVSLQSSTDVESTSFISEINFDEKLEEAHMLIERVRAALTDIGKGIHHVPDPKKFPNIDTPKTCVETCVISVPSVRECRSRKVVKLQEPTCDKARNACPRKSKEGVCFRANEIKVTKDEQNNTEEMDTKVVPEQDRIIVCMRPPEDATEGCYATEVNFESMEMLQEKLNTISEQTESDATNSAESKSAELPVPVVLTETASSPIDIKVLCICPSDGKKKVEPSLQVLEEEPSSVQEEQTATPTLSCDKVCSKKSANISDEKKKVEESIIVLKEESSLVQEGQTSTSSSTPTSTPTSTPILSCDKVCRRKSAKLSIQKLPTVSIHGGFVIQKTLHLCIKPTGSVINNVKNSSHRNVGYHEFNSGDEPKKLEVLAAPKPRKCPEICKDVRTNLCEQRLLLLDDLRSFAETQGQPVPTQDGKKKVSVSDDEATILYKSCQAYDDKKNVKCGNLKCPLKQKPPRNPIEMGFYKTQATQCDSLQDINEGQIIISRYDKTETSSKSSTPCPQSPQTSRGSLPLSPSSKTSLPSASATYSKSSQGSIKKSVSGSAEAVEKTSSYLETKEDSDQEKPVRESSVSSRDEVEPHVRSLKSEVTSNSSTSSSDSSYNVAGSFSNVVEIRAIAPKPTTANATSASHMGLKRRHTSDSEEDLSGGDSQVRQVPVKEYSVPSKETVKSQNSAASKEIKVDENIQVFLGSSSEDERDSERSNVNVVEGTIQSFIKGLTGTSEDQLHTFRSVHSFHRNSWSKGHAKSSHDQTRGSGRAHEEEVLNSHDYTGKPSLSTMEDSKDDLNDSKEDLHDDSGTLDDYYNEGDRKNKDKIVMRLQIETGKSCEGQVMPNRELPFYRRVLGKVVEPLGPMSKSFSTGSPDDSYSEGEVKFKNSYSIGEVITHAVQERKRRDRKTEFKNLKRYTEEVHRKELEDNTSKISRQRMQYNHWVTHYLLNQNKLPKRHDNSSTISTSSSHRK